MLNGKSVLITGGTGTFGKAFVGAILKRYPEVRRVVIYSRDELKQFEMAQLAAFNSPVVRYFIGDVRDRDRLVRAMEGIDVVIHAAALKQVPAAEYNPFEAIKTNVIGGQNVVDACMDQGVQRVVALSTDKAAAPINLYGATKLCSDKLFVAANNFRGARDVKLSVVRYGNVMGSRGSVIPFFLKQRQTGTLPITDPQMTRFNITIGAAIDFVLMALQTMWGGEIFVPKIPSYRITDVAKAIGPECEQEIVGLRPGEKLHEEMITSTDSYNAAEFDGHYVILPSLTQHWTPQEYFDTSGSRPCEPGFYYNSGSNSEWLSIEQLRELIRTHVDPSFAPLAS